MNTKPLPEFSTKAEAIDWMYESVDDPCTDNFRFAKLDDADAMDEYCQNQSDGCCGFFDNIVIIAGEKYMIGCNYGH